MTPVTLVELGQIGTLVIGSLGIAVALWNQRRQLNAQMFVEFSGRFQELLRMFPPEAWLANRDPSRPLPEESTELTGSARYCFQFITTAFYLRRAGYISRGIWRLWDREISRTLRGPVFQREWRKLSVEFVHDPGVLTYIKTRVDEDRW